MGAWGVVVAGGLGIAYMLNKGANRAETSQEPLVEPGVGTGLVPAGAAFVPSESDQDTGPANNQAWGQQALNWLITQGQNAAVADNAIRKYLAGEALTLQENALIGLALTKFGAPPEALPPTTVPTIPPPTTPPPVATDTGTPSMSVTKPEYGRRHKIGTRVPLWGAVKIGGKAPVLPQNRIVTVTVFKGNRNPSTAAIYQRFYLTVNTAGTFTTSTGWGATGSKGSWRIYQFIYKGIITNKKIYYV
jgi:hypothetical protein